MSALGLLANDTDPNGDPLTTALQYADPSQGVATVQSDGSFVFVPAGFIHASRTFGYRASDVTNTSNTATTVDTGGRAS